MKKKIALLSLCVALLAVAIVGGTMAYFTDTDAQKNTFTTGNVAIDLWEDFGDNDGMEKLFPAVGSAQDGTLENGIEKEVYVENTGSENAYVRVHIAIPAELDDPDNAGNNTLHFNYSPDSVGAGKWDWSTNHDEPYTGDWNFYTINLEIEDEVEGEVVTRVIPYNVYVVTYDVALAPGTTTVDAISQVYLDSGVTNERIAEINALLGDEWYIYVAAEGTQTEGFDNAYEALNTSFGDPSDPDYTSTIDWVTVTGKTWVDLDPTEAPEVTE